MRTNYSKIADKMNEKKDEILENWEQRIREHIPEAKYQDKAAIYNTLPELFDRMAQTLSKSPPKVTAELEKELEIARVHGEQRSQLRDYSIEQIIFEYQLLRQVTLEKLEEGGHLIAGDRDVILDALALSERLAAKEFHKIKLELEGEVKATRKDRDEMKEQRDLSRLEVSDLQSERNQRETFVATLSHDLLNPITAALMNAQFLIRKKDQAGALELYTGRIMDNLGRISTMIKNLLDANRIQSGQKIPIKIIETDLLLEIQQVLDTLTAIHGARFSIESQGPIVGFWDPSAIKRMFENLCSNAIKYGDTSRPISVSAQVVNKDQVQIRVHNHGNPIKKEDQSRLFQLFQRVDKEKSGHLHGWGIGLVLVKGMAEAHAGKVQVESSENAGTTFTIQLPLDSRPK